MKKNVMGQLKNSYNYDRKINRIFALNNPPEVDILLDR